MSIDGYQYASGTKLADQLRTGRVTAPQLVAEAVRLVAALDDSGPRLTSILAMNPEAQADAEAAQRAADAGAHHRPLQGLPVLVKDNIDIRGPLPTTAGSLALAAQPAPADANLVARLRAAGAIVLGKANLSEWGNFRASRATRGWSAVRGLVRNPHRLDRSAAGSSSGSGAAVAAGIVPFAIGTETDASIVAPAAVNGIVGLKPTVGLVSQLGIVPISHNQDTAGPMARSVRDVALLLDAITSGPVRQPERGAQADATRYVDFCTAPELAELSVGVPRPDWTGVHPATVVTLEDAVRALSRAGVRIVDDVELPAAAELAEADYELTVLLYDCKWDIHAYLKHRQHPGLTDLADLIAFNRAHADRELQHFGQDLFERAAAMGSRDEPEYTGALRAARRCGRDEGIDHALAHSGVDALIVPGFGPAWKSDLVYGDGPDLNHMTSPAQVAAVAGYPLLTVPAGSVGGLPIGVTLMGGAWNDGVLLRLGQAIENGLDAALTPAFTAPDAG